MGLYINHYHNLFKNNDDLQEPNQQVFVHSHMAEMIKQQKQLNDALFRSFNEISERQTKQGITQAGRWKAMNERLGELRAMDQRHQEIEQETLERLRKMEAGQLSRDQVIQQMEKLEHSNLEIINWLKVLEEESGRSAQKIDQQTEQSQKLTAQLSKQEAEQDDVVSRLENQEAILEKISRQMEHFREVLFERSGYLAEKIEDGYHLTSSYVDRMLKKSDQPVAFYMVQRQKEEKDR